MTPPRASATDERAGTGLVAVEFDQPLVRLLRGAVEEVVSG